MFEGTKLLQFLLMDDLLFGFSHDAPYDLLDFSIGDVVFLVVLILAHAHEVEEVGEERPVFDELGFHVEQTLIGVDVGGLFTYVVACELRVDEVGRELVDGGVVGVPDQHRVVLDGEVLKLLGSDDQMVDDVDLHVGEQHQVELCLTLQLALYLVSYVVLLLTRLYHFLDDEGRVV